MNAFDYWFDYIVRNGEYCPHFINTPYWLLRVGSYTYRARIEILEENERYIRVFRDEDNSWWEIVTASNTRPLDDKIMKNEAFKQLLSRRSIT